MSYPELKDNRTFDIYNKYDIYPENFNKSLVTPEQWEYIKQIGYIDEGYAKELEEIELEKGG